MKIKSAQIKNFRLLKEVQIDFEDELSLVVGKNNSGKTSFLATLEKFLTPSRDNEFTVDDFNLDHISELKDCIESDQQQVRVVHDYNEFYIGLKIEIECNEQDDLRNVSDFMLDLNPDYNTIILAFDYVLGYEKYKLLVEDFKSYIQKAKIKEPKREDLDTFLTKRINRYFIRRKQSLEVGNETNALDIEDAQLRKVLSFKVIKAKRDVTNDERKSSNALSQRTSRLYQTLVGDNDAVEVTDLQKLLIETDKLFTKEYKNTFKDILENIERFSSGAAQLEVHSTIQETELFKDNTTVRYLQDQQNLPETHNGLGYMNLYAMLFDIHICLNSFKCVNNDLVEPADINLLFIEEPEAHTHPQMQYIFINNIKEMLREGKGDIQLQTVVSTHSPHIVSQSCFADIKYFIRIQKNAIIVKNVSDLEKIYNDLGEGDGYRFLKQYLTVHNAELFFSAKAIFIEGVTERILLPAFMFKLDNENKETDGYKRLLSQNISIIELGNYTHVFDKFLRFLGITYLVITDIDAVNDDGACSVIDGHSTSNKSIEHYLADKNFEELKSLIKEEKNLNYTDNTYIQSETGNLCIAYQTEEDGYYARSFEDAFISQNIQFIFDNKDNFLGLKNKGKIETDSTDYYDLANSCINKKSHFSADILYYSDDSYSNWQTPEYIREGLLWLTQQ